MIKTILSSFYKVFAGQRINKDEFYLSEADWKDIDRYYEVNQLIYNVDLNEPNIPNIIKNGRLKYRNNKLCDLYSMYFSSLPNMMENKPQSLDKLISLIDESLLLLESLIMFEKIKWGDFQIKSIPPIENGLLCYSLLSDSKKIVDLKEVIEFFPDLKFYLDKAEDSVRFCTIIPELLNFIQNRGAVNVSDFKDTFSEDFELIKNRMYYLAKFDILKKTKVGRQNIYEIS